MDLNSLLNNQKEVTISLQDIKELRADPDSAAIVDKIRSFTAFVYPQNKADSFIFFDTFIQLLLFIDLEDDPYGAQYTKTIMINAFRKCINGLLLHYGNGWLIEFPSHFTASTWVAMRKHKDATILVYLYGLVLTFANEEVSKKWLHSLLQFMQSGYVGIIVNLWLTCCCTLEDNDQIEYDYAQDSFLNTFEERLRKEPQATARIAETTLDILKKLDTAYLHTHIDQFLGSALGRAVFTKDDFTMGCIQLENKLENISNFYPRFKKIYIQHKAQSAGPKEFINPLLNTKLLETWTTDKYEQANSIRKGSLFWIQKMGELTSTEFDVNLRKVITQQYPTDKKTVLDRLLADWTARDRFHRHLEFVANILMDLLASKPYNKRSAPYYAFVQLFNIPDEHHQRNLDMDNNHYETKSGAYIDLSLFSNCSDQPLMKGCCQLLQKVTQSRASPHVIDWVGDCLLNASTDIVKHYFAWLVDGFNTEIIAKTNPPRFEPFLKVALKSCQNASAHIVPILLENFNDESLEWLLKRNKPSAQALLHYFDDGPQVSKYIMVQGLFMNKKKKYIDLLLAFLRESMAGTDPKLPRSRSWFKNHFLGVILSLVGDDSTGQGVACCIFRQLFKTRENFEWYFSTALVPTERKLNYKALHFANLHDVFDIKDSGLAAVFHEMVRLGDTEKKKRLIKVWYDLWTSGSKITVPVSWILQCAGLYDQAPVLVKQMIKKLVTIGLEQQQMEEQRIVNTTPDRKFLDRIMDLVLLSDAPEPESLFELILNVSQHETIFQEVNHAVINILIELSEELEFELMASETPPPPELNWKVRENKRVNKHRQKQSARKLREAIKKHEAELEEYLKQSKNTTIKAITTLVQRVFNFLLCLLTNTSSVVDEVNTSLLMKQEIRNELVTTPLIYKPLSKLLRLIQEPENLQEDVQTTIDLCLEYLKKRPDSAVYNVSQKILVL